jgi:putative PIN family toxin of toxin-antitoxin system
MPGEIRAVLDTNIFISGVIHQAGLPGQILVAWRSGRFELITSAEINEEILEVLNRPRIREKYHIEDRIIDVGAILYTQATLVEPKHRLKVSKDPDDNKFLEAALQGSATYIVTGDKKDLLLLKEYKGIHIVTPTKFIKIIA